MIVEEGNVRYSRISDLNHIVLLSYLLVCSSSHATVSVIISTLLMAIQEVVMYITW